MHLAARALAASAITLSAAGPAAAQSMQFVSQNQEGRAQNPPEMEAMEARWPRQGSR